ncbi:MAG: FtsQ-type POTRA domain-containing protein [Spirochaetales bacterium]|nr:FtsQ-type POTRA domain-containing protein [Spirochaetales bacterium]
MSSIAVLNGLYSRRQAEPGGRIRRLFLILIAVLFVILLMEIVFHFVISPRLRLTKVEISAGGALALTDETIIRLAGLKGGETFFEVNEEEISGRIASFAPVKSVQVEKVFPNTLKIHIQQREPLAVSLSEVEGRSVPIILDEEGVVFQIGSSVSDFDLPALSGFTFENIELGQRVNRALTGFFENLKKLKNDSPALYNLISELKFVKKDRAGFEVVLFPRDYRVAVRIGSRINVDIMRKILLVLDVFSNQGMITSIEEIDFRTETPLVRFKEE